jgi:hypothetical protein
MTRSPAGPSLFAALLLLSACSADEMSLALEGGGAPDDGGAGGSGGNFASATGASRPRASSAASGLRPDGKPRAEVDADFLRPSPPAPSCSRSRPSPTRLR